MSRYHFRGGSHLETLTVITLLRFTEAVALLSAHHRLIIPWQPHLGCRSIPLADHSQGQSPPDLHPSPPPLVTACPPCTRSSSPSPPPRLGGTASSPTRSG
ncbi:hypothetical protein ACJRO7_009693 [Eucalyptus globulus]|uniref:Uncharacterized protein n=1 Tax=Eucalyptus globulus TaxID=34317 RepID=A0ABD3LF30_EUCGL